MSSRKDKPNVLVIAPHPDDEVIGCGGAIRLRADRGERITVVYLTSGELGLKKLPREKAWKIREAEARRGAKILGIAKLHFLRQPDWMLDDNMAAAAKSLRAVLDAEKPDVIYLPHPADGHPDHKVTLQILRAAMKRRRNPKPELLAYEVWTPMPQHDVVADISSVMRQKLRALRAHSSQLDEFDYEQALTGLNQFRGALSGKCRFAEVFQSLAMRA